MFRSRKTLTGLVALAAVVSLPATTALAGVYHNTNTVYGAAESHDDPFGDSVVWFNFEIPGGQILPATGVMLNEWYGLTAAHVFTACNQSATNHVVGDGDNYLTNPGTTRAIADFGVHPNWYGTFCAGFLSQIDLAWFKLDQPIPGAGVGLGVAALNDVLTVPEFGYPATPGGSLPVDGERRAFDVVVDSFGEAAIVSNAYLVCDFLPLVFRNMPLAGMGTDGASGSPWFNESGEVVGITAGGAGGHNYFGITDAVDLAPHHSWIIANTHSVLDCPGDADGSRVVDLADFAVVQVSFGQLTEAMFSDGDFDHDDDVDIEDVITLVDEMGNICP
jgi:hypothetical protein